MELLPWDGPIWNEFYHRVRFDRGIPVLDTPEHREEILKQVGKEAISKTGKRKESTVGFLFALVLQTTCLFGATACLTSWCWASGWAFTGTGWRFPCGAESFHKRTTGRRGRTGSEREAVEQLLYTTKAMSHVSSAHHWHYIRLAWNRRVSFSASIRVFVFMFFFRLPFWLKSAI